MQLIEPKKTWGISQKFGNNHNGIDYKYPSGTEVTAAADGVIDFEGWGQNDPWTLWLGGIYVRIKHGDGSYTGYAHLSRTIVDKGNKVKAGQVIGYSGNTGQSSGPHLHFEVIPAVQQWNNGYSARIDPSPFFIAGGSTTQQDTLWGDQHLAPNQAIVSGNGVYKAIMQSDGNFVIYKNGNKAIWATGTNGKGANTSIMQSDGNFVLYRGGTPIWATNTNGKGGKKMVMQNDGNLVIYTNSGRAVWASNTNGK